MVVKEIKKEKSSVRIHDDFCETPQEIQRRIERITQILTNSYKRSKIETLK